MHDTPVEVIERHVVQQLVSPTGYSQYLAGDIGHGELRRFTPEIVKLSQAYTAHSVGSKLREVTDTELRAEAYALYYLPINAAKIAHLALSLPPSEKTLRVLDFGSGPGTAALALLATLPLSLEITCVESSESMRRVATKLLSSWQGPSTIASLNMIPRMPRDWSESFDIVIAANSFAELGEQDATALVSRLAHLVSPEGFLMLLEPGQQAHSRRLMRIRDSLVPQLTPLFPCTHMAACPMLLASSTDWCHGTLAWRQPPLNRQLDALLGFNKHRIKYSGFVFQQGGRLRPGARVIVPAEKTQRGIEVTVCGDQFYGVVRIKKGQRTDGSRALERASVFDRIESSEPLRSELSPTLVTTRCSP